MWRGHQTLPSTVQRWMLRGRRHTSIGGYRLLFSSRCLGGATFAASSDKLLQRSSIFSGSDDLPSLVGYDDVNKKRCNLLISCHAFSTGSGNRPKVPRMKDLYSVEEVIMTAYEHLDLMSRRDVSAVWARIALLMTKRQPRQQSNSSNREDLSMEDMQHMLFTLFDDTTHGIKDCGARELTETTLGMAKIVKILRDGKKRGEDSSQAILREVLLNKDMKPNEELFQFFADASMNTLDQFDARCLSNLAYAYALIKYVPEFDDGSDLLNHIAMKAVGKTKELKPQELSNIVWAFATAAISHPTLFENVANHIVRLDSLNRFTHPQDVSNTVWAYATAGIHHAKLFEKMANHIVGLNSLDKFTHPQDVSNTVWAYATAGIHHPKLFEKVANHIIKLDNLDRFEPQHLSNTLWAYAKAGIHHPKLFEKMANHIVESGSLDKFDPQALKDTVWAYATAQVPHPKLFQKVAKAAIQRKEEFNNSQGVANLLWAYATMGIVDKQLFSSFVPTAANLIDICDNQGLANLAWAYAVADVDAPTLFNDHFINKCNKEKDGFKNEALFQLHQWHLWQTKEKSNPGLPLELQDRCYNSFISEETTVSKFQDDVVTQLSSIGLGPKEEVLMDSGYRIDAVVEVNGNTVGVEVDGPYHFIGSSKSPLARTILKRRQVPSIDGIELVSVPYWEWNKLLGKDEVKRQEYLRKLLGLATEET
jgi:hypothetical protein